MQGGGSIEVGTALWNQTAGLCGTLDGLPEDVSAGAAGLDLASYVSDWQSSSQAGTSQLSS
jgi:hypothetical protein